MTVLFFDLGNTRIKWCFKNASGALSYDNLAQELDSIPVWRRQALEIVFASVVKDQRRERFLQALRVRHGRIHECVVTSHALGVSCAYQDVTRLGVDRWLAVLAAWQRYHGPVLVVDLGTAVTLDFVAAGGHHLGGYILPGLKLGVEGLLAGTSAVQVDADLLRTASREPGRNTTEAVYNGAIAAMAATIEGSLARFRGDFADARLLLTGGDSVMVAVHLRCEYEIADQLVFEGMSLLHAGKLTVEVSNQDKP